jgi:hypothetical protein
MQLLSFRIDEERSFGALVEGKVVDLGKHMPEFDSLRELLIGDALVRALDTSAEESAEYRSDAITWLPPLRNPDQLFCLFDDLNADPVLVDPPTIVGHQRPIPCPAPDSAIVWAGIAIYPGQPAATTRVNPIAGLSLITYLVPGGVSLGPTLVTPDEFPSLSGLTVTVKCGDVVQEVELHDIEAALGHVAASQNLAVGDVIAVLQQIRDIPIGEADAIEVSCDATGELKNPLDRGD